MIFWSLFFVLGVVFCVTYLHNRYMGEQFRKIKKLGYDAHDVYHFCLMTQTSIEMFVIEEGVRKSYEDFKNVWE